MVAFRSGDIVAARAAADAHAAITRDLGGGTSAAMSAFLRGSTRWQDEPEVALEALEESIALTKAGAGGPSYGSALSLIVRLRLRAGDIEEARSRLLDALEYARSTQRYLLGIVLDQGAEVVASLGDMQAAAVLVGAADARHVAFVAVTSGDEGRTRRETRCSTELSAELGADALRGRGRARCGDDRRRGGRLLRRSSQFAHPPRADGDLGAVSRIHCPLTCAQRKPRSNESRRQSDRALAAAPTADPERGEAARRARPRRRSRRTSRGAAAARRAPRAIASSLVRLGVQPAPFSLSLAITHGCTRYGTTPGGMSPIPVAQVRRSARSSTSCGTAGTRARGSSARAASASSQPSAATL